MSVMNDIFFPYLKLNIVSVRSNAQLDDKQYPKVMSDLPVSTHIVGQVTKTTEMITFDYIWCLFLLSVINNLLTVEHVLMVTSINKPPALSSQAKAFGYFNIVLFNTSFSAATFRSSLSWLLKRYLIVDKIFYLTTFKLMKLSRDVSCIRLCRSGSTN